MGIAAVGAVFFAQLATNGGHWGLAFRTALIVTLAFVLIALAAAVWDVRAARRSRPVPLAAAAHAGTGRAPT